MVLEARLRIRHRGCFTERLAGASQGAQIAADRDADVYSVHGPEVATLEAILRPTEVISRTPTSLVARARGAPHEVVATISGAGCTIVWPAMFVGGEEIYNVLAPSREKLDDLVAKLAAHGPTLVERVADAPPASLSVNVPVADITTALTQRQLVVLQTAIAEGYYDSPRRTSTEALAAAFGVTRSTLEEHLRKAERRILEGFAGVLAAQPVIARAAARRPGRPAAKPTAR